MAEEEKRKKAPVVRTIIRGVSLVYESGEMKALLFNIGWILTGAIASLSALFNKNFLNAAADVVMGKSGAVRLAVLWLLIWSAVEVGQRVLDMISARVSANMTWNMDYYLSQKLFHKVSRIRLHYFDDREEQRRIRNVKGFSWKIWEVCQSAIQILRSCVMAITAIAVIAGENWKIAILICVTSMPAVLVGKRQTEEQYYMSQGHSFDEQMQRYMGLVITNRKYIKEMHFYQLYDYMGEKFDKTVISMMKQRVKFAKKYLMAGLASDLVAYAAIAVSLLMISVEIFHGRAGIGSFVLIYSTAQTLQGTLKALFASLDTIGDKGRYLEDYDVVMAFEEEAVDKGTDEEGGLEIVFEHVYFTYPGSEREVLTDINLTIHAKEKIAIVGENGSGKSTFIALLTGLYSPTKGRILVNDKDISQMLGFLREHISCTTQDYFQLHGSVEDNVLIGDCTHAHDGGDVREALRKAGLLDALEKYEKKEKTNLGNLYKDSVDLSGGQWQKLAMARNLYKDGASLMILDEPTAALDPMAESKLYHDFSKLSSDKGVVLISHRLGATRLAERVLVFHEGKIVEDGTHEELLKADGLYTQMYHAQAQWYVS